MEEERQAGRQPVRRIDPKEAPREERPKGRARRTRGERESAQDEEDVDARLPAECVGVSEQALAVVEDHERDRHTLQLVDRGEALAERNPWRKVYADGVHVALVLRDNLASLEVEAKPHLLQALVAHRGAQLVLVAGVEHEEAAAPGADQLSA